MQDALADYNELHYKQPLEIVIFSFILDNTIKINRSVMSPYASTIIISEEGSGANPMTKLATYLAHFICHELDTEMNYQKEDWSMELKQTMAMVGIEKKQVVYCVQEKDVIFPEILLNLDALAAHGELVWLFNKEETENLIHQTRFRSLTA